MTTRKPASPRSRTKKLAPKGPTAARLDELIEDATVDAHDESEQRLGFYTVLEQSIVVPFKTKVLGVEVTVERIDMTDDEQIVALCSRGRARQRIPLLDLPLPDPPPEGIEWLQAFRRWARGSRGASGDDE
jgi:hypothetical protein